MPAGTLAVGGALVHEAWNAPMPGLVVLVPAVGAGVPGLAAPGVHVPVHVPLPVGVVTT